MSILRPGKFEITEKAMEICNFPKGARLLDVGCGDGTIAEFLQDKYGYDVEGIDTDLSRISEGKERNPNLKLRFGDGEFLEDFTSFSFDGVLMECTLSLINLADEALHEAYCVLKKGGKLVISDLYMKDPDPKKVEAIRIEAERQSKIPHQSHECSDECAQEHQNRFLDFRFEGLLIEQPLLRMLKEIGYKVVLWEDRTADLETYVAETIMEKGSLDDCITAANKDRKGTGYFLLIAEKPAK